MLSNQKKKKKRLMASEFFKSLPDSLQLLYHRCHCCRYRCPCRHRRRCCRRYDRCHRYHRVVIIDAFLTKTNFPCVTVFFFFSYFLNCFLGSFFFFCYVYIFCEGYL